MELIFKALSDPTRLRILALLAQGERCVCELEGALQLSQPNISRQVNLLKTSGLLQSKKQAQWAYYQISSDFINAHPGLWIYLIEQFPKLPTYEQDRMRLLNKQENKCI